MDQFTGSHFQWAVRHLFEFSDQLAKLLDSVLELSCIRHATPFDCGFCSAQSFTDQGCRPNIGE
jgi:hypothetical protein